MILHVNIFSRPRNNRLYIRYVNTLPLVEQIKREFVATRAPFSAPIVEARPDSGPGGAFVEEDVWEHYLMLKARVYRALGQGDY